MSIGENIKKRREQLGMTADDLAKAIGKNRATVYRYESAEIEKFPLDVLEPLCKALNISPAEIMGWTISTTEKENQMLELFRNLNNQGQEDALKYLKLLQLNPDYKKPSESLMYIVAESTDNRPSEIRHLTDDELKRIKAAKPVTSDDDL